MSKFLLIHFRRYIVSICLLSFSYSSFACTAINLTAKDGTVIAGRTMEWEFEMKWELMSVPKGTDITLSAPSALNLPETKISSKYAFVGGAPGVLEGPPAFLDRFPLRFVYVFCCYVFAAAAVVVGEDLVPARRRRVLYEFSATEAALPLLPPVR